MKYEKDGLSASVVLADEVLVVSEFEIDDEVVMDFGEQTYLPAMGKFIRHLRNFPSSEIRVTSMRSGFSMLFARFGFVQNEGIMVWRSDMPETPSSDAATFNRISGSSFEGHSRILMEDGREIPIQELDVGDRVAEGGLVTGISRGRQRTCHEVNGCRFSSAAPVFMDGMWMRVEDHPDSEYIFCDKGWDGYGIKTEKHLLKVEGYLFADFMECPERIDSLKGMSDQAMELMNANHS